MDQYTGGTTWSNDSLSTRAFEALANPYRRQLLLAMFEKNPQDDDDLDPLRLLEQGGGGRPMISTPHRSTWSTFICPSLLTWALSSGIVNRGTSRRDRIGTKSPRYSS